MIRHSAKDITSSDLIPFGATITPQRALKSIPAEVERHEITESPCESLWRGVPAELRSRLIAAGMFSADGQALE